MEEDPTGGKYAAQTGQLGGAPNKLETVINFHVRGEGQQGVAGKASVWKRAVFLAAAIPSMWDGSPRGGSR